ncbi:Ff.00g070590.m01.CDS01 [Fusarium sp. VM40]|nr:Ff.00g070590.m01.CDS01 [Fusarium sp. VM40]
MASSEIPQHPVFKEFVAFIRYLPSLGDESGKFAECLGHAEKENRKCHRPNAKTKQKDAEDLWKSFKGKDKCPDDLAFYENVEIFLTIVHCWDHIKDARPLFNNWKQHRVDNLSCTSLPSTSPDSSLIDHDILPPLVPFTKDDTPQTPRKRASFSLSYASDEASLPGTPDSDRVFDSPSDCNMTPFSSPPTADYYSPQAWKESSNSGSDGFFLSPSRRLFESPPFYADKDNSATDCDQKITSTVAISTTSTAVDAPGDVGKPGVVVDTIIEINTASPQELSKEFPIMIKKEYSIEETTTNISITQANAPVADNPLAGDTAVGKCSLKRQGTLRGGGPILVEIYDYLTPIQLKKGIVYVLQHKEHADIFKIGFSEHSADKRLNQPGNCYRDFYKPIYESAQFFAAHKAEAIAMVFLRGMNLHITKCYKCGKKHRELFQGDKEKVVGTVQAMVSFVRDGAYEKDKDGVWKLSAYANNKVEFSPMGLLASEELQKGPESTQPKSESEPEDTIDAKPITIEHTTIVQVAVDIHIESTEVDESTSKPPALPKKSRPSIGTMLGKLKTKISGPSRESTPEVEDAQEPSKTPIFTEENIVKTLWFLIRDEDKPENCFEDGKGPRTWGSLAKGVDKVKDKLMGDYTKARAG